MRDFVPQYCRQTIVVLADGQNVGEDEDLASSLSSALPSITAMHAKLPWNDECILFFLIDHMDLPVAIRYPADWDEPVHHPLYHPHSWVPFTEDLPAILLQNLLILLVS